MVLLLLAFPNGARAQAPSTVTQKVFTNASCASTLTSSALQNIGQIGHSFSFTTISPGSNLQVQIQGSADNSTWFQISNDAQAQPGIIVGVGAYPFLRIQVTNGGAGCTISGTYVGSSAATTVNVAASNAQFMYQRNALVNLSAGSNQSTTGIVPPYGNAAGFIVFSYLGGAGPSGSTISVSCPDSLTGTSVAVASTTLATTVNTAQVLSVPNFSCSSITVSYISGGASANTFSAGYYFTYPGMAPIITPPSAAAGDPCQSSGVNKSSVPIPSIASATTLQLISPVSGKTVDVCTVALMANISGTTGSAQFVAGTGATCGVGAVTLTGVMSFNNNVIPFVASGTSQFNMPMGDGFCITTTGTFGGSSSMAGWIIYVQQ